MVVLWVIRSPLEICQFWFGCIFILGDEMENVFGPKERDFCSVCSFAVTNEDLKGFPTKHVKILVFTITRKGVAIPKIYWVLYETFLFFGIGNGTTFHVVIHDVGFSRWAGMRKLRHQRSSMTMIMPIRWNEACNSSFLIFLGFQQLSFYLFNNTIKIRCIYYISIYLHTYIWYTWRYISRLCYVYPKPSMKGWKDFSAKLDEIAFFSRRHFLVSCDPWHVFFFGRWKNPYRRVYDGALPWRIWWRQVLLIFRVGETDSRP